jgi:O-methyltransferase
MVAECIADDLLVFCAMIKRLFRMIAPLLEQRNTYLSQSMIYNTTKPKIDLKRADFVRYATLELVRQEIERRSLTGSVAEVGVYRGDFASQLNLCFPNRKLYLFDTFEGFDTNDVEVERKKGFSTGEQDFSDTSVDLVLSKMVNPQQCVVRKGFFPETAKDIDDKFVFVSLDADLYQPIYEGLAYFYPRLEAGGYIFIHDVNNEEYKGARQALEQFCAEQGIGFVPLADYSGTAVISK